MWTGHFGATSWWQPRWKDRKRREAAFCLLLALTLADQWIHFVALAFPHWLIVKSVSLGFHHRRQISNSSGILEASSSARSGLFSHPAKWAENILGPQSLRCETTICELLGLHPVSQCNESYCVCVFTRVRVRACVHMFVLSVLFL